MNVTVSFERSSLRQPLAASLLSILFVVAFAVLPAAPARAADAAQQAEQAVLDAHEKRRAATLKGDAEAVAAMMTDDFTFTHPNAVVETKAQFVDALKSGQLRYRSITDEARQARVHGDTGIVSGTCRIVVNASGTEFDVRVRFTELWVKMDGGWRMALWHATEVPPAKE
jgi:uncharacterized protein (TIGR02246 family)